MAKAFYTINIPMQGQVMRFSKISEDLHLYSREWLQRKITAVCYSSVIRLCQIKARESTWALGSQSLFTKSLTDLCRTKDFTHCFYLQRGWSLLSTSQCDWRWQLPKHHTPAKATSQIPSCYPLSHTKWMRKKYLRPSLWMVPFLCRTFSFAIL